MKRWLAGLCLAVVALSGQAAGPQTVAQSDRSLWPEPLNSSANFDRASRAEMLVFADALTGTTTQSDALLKEQLHLKQLDRESIQSIQKRLLDQLWVNWQQAASSCKAGDAFCPSFSSVEALVAASHTLATQMPVKYRPWYDNAQAFHQAYAGELVRLAALFPKTSSEISTFSAIEHNGFELPDRHFLLTFDDGPTNAQGNTDHLLPLLDKSGLHATFYLLGERLADRLNHTPAPSLQQAYAQQCVAMHGWQHQSHAKWSDWQKSVLDTRDLVKQTFPSQYRAWFRPPYGQRLSDSGSFFSHQGLQVALWNIDSQDWNSHVKAADAGQRVLTLMLLWRRGVILFHDIHAKAEVAVPWLLNNTAQAGVVWQDCHGY